MKKFIIVSVLVLMAAISFGMSAQVIDVNSKTGWVNVTGVACNLSNFTMYSWANMTITAYDAVSSTVVDGTSNTLFVVTAMGIANLTAANVWPAVIDLAAPVYFDTGATFLTPVKPFAAYKRAAKGIVLLIDAYSNSSTGKFFITIE